MEWRLEDWIEGMRKEWDRDVHKTNEQRKWKGRDKERSIIKNNKYGINNETWRKGSDKDQNRMKRKPATDEDKERKRM